MNPLKTLFRKVFDSTPPTGTTDAATQDAAFDWNPDEETVAPTSARATSWKRGDTVDESPAQVAGEATHAEIAEAAHSLPTPVFERDRVTKAPASSPPTPAWNQPVAVAPPPAEPATLTSVKLPAPSARPGAPVAASASPQNWVKPNVPDQPAAVAPLAAQSVIPLSDFEDVYRKAGIKSPVHGYGVERVYRLLTSRRLVGLDRSVRRSALLTALDAAGVPASDVAQDAVLRRKALTAYEAEKALELQSLRSRNESRAEALQDTVETFTRQKQSQIERLAQGSTSAVRAQSDLEIRKRMEQDRLYRSLAYFLEPLPSGTGEARPAPPKAPKAIYARTAEPQTAERLDATMEMSPLARESVPESRESSSGPMDPPAIEAVTQTKAEGPGADTLAMSQSGLELALKAAAEEARQAGWGKAAIVEHSAGDPVEALRKLREPPKTEPES
jgi:hypothetical protein